MPADLSVALVYEDIVSEAVLLKLLDHSERPFRVELALHSHGSGNIKRHVPRYLNACKALPHIVLTDLDQHVCASSLMQDWGLANKPAELLFRVAVREVEAWLLADRHGLAQFLSVPVAKISQNPEALQDPKGSLISLARSSRSRRLRQEIVPAHGSSVAIGPLYNERLTGFVRDSWSIDDAILAAPSLARLVARLETFLA